jgi:inhibitor of KinA sporulation pathway (predicted exonuclease)
MEQNERKKANSVPAAQGRTISNPLRDGFFGIQEIGEHEIFTDRQQLPKCYDLKQTLELVGMEIIGTHHRGIDDGRNITRLLPYIVGERTLDRAAFPD